MDAFVQRSPRFLFRRDRFVLWPQRAQGAGDRQEEGDSGDDEDDEWQDAALLTDHGGQIVDAHNAAAQNGSDSGRHDGEFVVVVSGARSTTSQADAAAAAANDMLRAQQRFPLARVVTAAWVRDCVAQKKRLPTASYEIKPRTASHAAVPSANSADDGAAADGEPPRKRVKATATATSFFGVAATATTAEDRDPSSKPHFRPWQSLENGSLLVLDARPLRSSAEPETKSLKVASFDLDGTLIVTKSGKRFAQNDNDWQWFHPTRVTDKLAELLADGYNLVLFSNQNGIEKGKVSAAEVQRKVSTIVKKLDLPMLVFLATRDDQNRKPRVNAWTRMVEMLQSEGAVSKEESFYCGDAAGRPKASGRPKDFAATDYKFALNLGVPFLTPEALFFASKQRLHTHPGEWEIGFDPRSIPVDTSSSASSALTKQHQEVVVLSGSPASMKSHLANSCFPSYVVVNQDELRTLANCKKACLEALRNGKSVVIDGTNRSKPTRKEWVTIAQSQNVPVRCFEMDVPKPLAMHLNVFRSLTTAKKIPDVAIHGFYKNYTQPEAAEGFEEVVKVQLRIDRAGLSAENFQLIRSFL